MEFIFSLYGFLEEHSLGNSLLIMLIAVFAQIILLRLKHKVHPLRFFNSLLYSLFLIILFYYISVENISLGSIIVWGVFILNVSISFYFPLLHEVLITYIVSRYLSRKVGNDIFIFYHTLHDSQAFILLERILKYSLITTAGKLWFLKATEKNLGKYHYRLLRINREMLGCHLTESEKSDVIFNISYHNLLLGNTKNAEENALTITDKVRQSHLLSLIYYEEGKFEKARKINHEIIYNSKNTSNELYFIALNNYSVFERNNNNCITTKQLYEKNISNVKKLKKNITHIAFQNLIDIYLLEENQNADLLMSEYQELFKKGTLDDKIQVLDYKLTFYRQKGQLDNIPQLLSEIESYSLTFSGKKEYFIGILHLLKIAINNNLDFIPYFNILNKNIFEIIRSFSKLETVFFFIDFLDTYRSVRFQLGSRDEHNLHVITTYFDLNKEILTDYFNQIPIECVSHRCFILSRIGEMEKISCLRNNSSLKVALDEKIQKLEESLRIHLEHENILQAALMTFEILHNYIESIPEPSQEKVVEIQTIIDKYLNEAKKLTDKLETSSLKHRLNIELSYYTFVMNDKEFSYLLFLNFIKSGISINHFEKRIQEYFAYLNRQFNNRII